MLIVNIINNATNQIFLRLKISSQRYFIIHCKVSIKISIVVISHNLSGNRPKISEDS